MVSRKDYNTELVAAARSVLLELMHLLGEYRDGIVLIGGWVPEFLLPSADKAHVGSTDVDLALNHRKIQVHGYETIQKLLLNRDYRQGKQPFIFHRQVFVAGQRINVQVDLLAGEYEGTGPGHRHQKIQGLRARKARGSDLAFENSVEVTLEGTLPDGGKDSVMFRVAAIVPFLVMKGIALDDRLKEKDSWDIYYCVRNYPGGRDALITEFKKLLKSGLVQEGLAKIAKHFASENHLGPRHVADFEEVTDIEARELIQRDAYERINDLLKNLGVL